MNCKKCNQVCQKWGGQRNGRQRYYCKSCNKTQQNDYQYCVYKTNVVSVIPKLIRESVSIRGIGRILKIGTSTVIRKNRMIASAIRKPFIPVNRKAFELDEVRTFVNNKENQYWIAYAL